MFTEYKDPKLFKKKRSFLLIAILFSKLFLTKTSSDGIFLRIFPFLASTINKLLFSSARKSFFASIFMLDLNGASNFFAQIISFEDNYKRKDSQYYRRHIEDYPLKYNIVFFQYF